MPIRRMTVMAEPQAAEKFVTFDKTFCVPALFQLLFRVMFTFVLDNRTKSLDPSQID
jgi:hypothetical protein